MEIETDLTDDPALTPDAWAGSPTDPHWSSDGRWVGQAPPSPGLDLAALVASFVANGGKIQTVPQGASGVTVTGQLAFNPSFYTGPDVAPDVIAAREAHNRKVNSKYYGQDDKLVEQLRPLMAASMARKDVLAEMKMSDDRMQRLIRMYFLDDPVAEPYRKLTWDERQSAENPHDAGRAEQIRKVLDQGLTVTQAQRVLGYKETTFFRLVKKYGLKAKVTHKREKV